MNQYLESNYSNNFFFAQSSENEKCETDEILMMNQLGKRVKVRIDLSANVANMKEQIFSACGIEGETDMNNFDFCFVNAELRGKQSLSHEF